MRKFSIVVPIAEKDIKYLPITLPSWLSLKSDDILLCVDKPCSVQLRTAIWKISELYGKQTRIIEVERSSEWRFHQAHVRREGFRKAKHDVILTGDIDLVVNKNVYKAINLVGKDNIGLVSLAKFHYPRKPSDYWREFVILFSRKILHALMDKIMATTTFTGLYAFYRPFWLDTEKEEDAKRLVNPKQFYRGEKVDFSGASAVTGEDTFLRDNMIKKYRCVYLRDIGAIDLGVSTESLPYLQYATGQYFARRGRSTLVSIGRAFLRAQPHYLKGFLMEREKMRKTFNK